MSQHGDEERCTIATLVVAALLIGGFYPAGLALRAEARDEAIDTLIQQAGNADDDDVRLAYLKQLQKRPGLDGPLARDLEKLIAQIDRWTDDKSLTYFGRQISRTMDYDFGIPENSPIYPLTFLYRGRMVTWYTLESGGVWNMHTRKRAFLDKARRLFEKAAEYFPDNKIAGMYLGRPIGPEKHYHAVAEAPAWAIYQREALERLTDIIEWWIDNRMRDNGEFGGGWGDDCEMWRWWVPVLIGFDDPKITQAQTRFSEAMMAQPHMKLGYTMRMSDVEHTAEDSADVITPMMHLDPDSDVWSKRALRLAELMEKLWTGRNERSFLQFKSTYFTATKVDTNPGRACDTVYHPRAIQPALLYWQRTGDEELTRLFSAWMDTWVDAAARAERGKPAGIVPSAIHFPDGCVGGAGPNWWDPRNHGEYTLYLYPSAMGLMTHTLLLTHHMTGEDKYFEPLRSMAGIRLKYLNAPPATDPAPGSEAWCAARLGGVSGAIAKYRFLTGNTEFDKLLEKEMSPYMRFRLRDDRDSLISALQNTADALRINFPGYTSEVRYTDRVLRFPSLFAGNGLLPEPVKEIRRPDTALLYSTFTGDPGDAGYFPLNAVRWLTPPRDIAALVTESAPNRLTAELLHFGKDARPMTAELYLLEPGKYTMSVTPNDSVKGASATLSEVEVTKRKTRVSFDLPPRKLCVVRICLRQPHPSGSSDPRR